MTIDQAEAAFVDNKNPDTAMEYLSVAKRYWQETMIIDERFAGVLREIAYWLEFN